MNRRSPSRYLLTMTPVLEQLESRHLLSIVVTPVHAPVRIHDHNGHQPIDAVQVESAHQGPSAASATNLPANSPSTQISWE